MHIRNCPTTGKLCRWAMAVTVIHSQRSTGLPTSPTTLGIYTHAPVRQLITADLNSRVFQCVKYVAVTGQGRHADATKAAAVEHSTQLKAAGVGLASGFKCF